MLLPLQVFILKWLASAAQRKFCLTQARNVEEAKLRSPGDAASTVDERINAEKKPNKKAERWLGGSGT
jgi:hypothetical protein